MNANDPRRIAEALLEIAEFLIKYRVSTSNIEASKEIHEQKKVCIRRVLKNFVHFDDIFNNAKQKDLKSNEYIRNFVELMQNSKRETIDMIEVPILILNQKCNYLR